MEWDSESVKSEDVFKQPGNPEAEMKTQPSTPQSHAGVRLHEFVSKTVRMPFLWEKEIEVVQSNNIFFLLLMNLYFMSFKGH